MKKALCLIVTMMLALTLAGPAEAGVGRVVVKSGKGVVVLAAKGVKGAVKLVVRGVKKLY